MYIGMQGCFSSSCTDLSYEFEVKRVGRLMDSYYTHRALHCQSLVPRTRSWQSGRGLGVFVTRGEYNMKWRIPLSTIK